MRAGLLCYGACFNSISALNFQSDLIRAVNPVSNVSHTDGDILTKTWHDPNEPLLMGYTIGFVPIKKL